MSVGVLAYVLLAVSTLLATIAGDVIEHRSAAYRLGTIAVAGLAAGWMLWMVTLHRSWARRRRLMALYCAGLLLLLAVLVTRNSWFGLFALTGYLHTWELLPGRWRVAGVTTTAVIHVTAICVKAHLLHVYAKLGVNDRAAAVPTAYERGLLTPGGNLD